MPWPRPSTVKGTELAVRERADQALVRRGLVATVEDAARLIMAGRVHTAGRRIEKAGELVGEDLALNVRALCPYVSRGGIKLAHALETFGVEAGGVVAIDAGASTGGFTDCLLQAGAARVYAVDVAYGQLAWELRQDARVVVMERTNIRTLVAGDFDPRPELATIDLAFVSLVTVLEAVLSLLDGPRRMVALIKPQFEVAREALQNGVVGSEDDRQKAIEAVLVEADRLGLSYRGPLPSPVKGAGGNIESFVELIAGH